MMIIQWWSVWLLLISLQTAYHLLNEMCELEQTRRRYHMWKEECQIQTKATPDDQYKVKIFVYTSGCHEDFALNGY